MKNDSSLLSQEEYNKIVYDWNRTEAPYSKDKTIHQLFEEQVSRTPEAIAIVFEDKQLTYRDLNIRANQLAHTIRREYKQHWDIEVRSDTLIGIYIERSLEMVVGILGILKSGAAYVPFDKSDPPERLKFKINNCACKMVLTTSSYAKDLIFLAESDTLPFAIDSYWKEISKASNGNPERINKSNDLAYVIYTSGSTGKPKGVMIEHAGVINLVSSHNRSFQLYTANKRILQFASVSFDASIWEIFPALCTGAKLVVTPEHSRKDISGLVKLLSVNHVSIATFTPAILASLPKIKLPHLKTIIVAGDTCDKNVMNYWSEGRTFINAYGPTESTVCVSFRQYAGDLPTNIGRPISNKTFYVLGKNHNPVPLGVTGELYVGGDGIARGYLGLPELTDERFISNPFASDEDKAKKRNLRLYKTGDHVRWLSDGNLEFVGRKDNQIKIRGYRIELGEIESTLAKHPDVKQCVVLCKEHNKNKYLAAYYSIQTTDNGLRAAENSPRRTMSDQSDSLRRIQADIAKYTGFSQKSTQNPTPNTQHQEAFLREKLPDYMVPSCFIKMEKFPLNISGKIDRKALPEPVIKVEENNYEAPRNELERKLCEIWGSVLGVDNLGISDNFFRLGGNSISAIRMINRLQEIVKSVVHIGSIYEGPTVKEYAKYLIKNGYVFEHESQMSSTIAPKTIKDFKNYLSSLKTHIPAKKIKTNKRVCFILSSPRSGSTMLRAILMSHSKIFAPPEMPVVLFNELSALDKHSLNQKVCDIFTSNTGIIRTLMELENCDLDGAKSKYSEMGEYTPVDFYSYLLKKIDQPVFIEKSTIYPFHPDALSQIERLFSDPKYIFLQRHPFGVINSFVENKIHLLGFANIRRHLKFSPQHIAELAWQTANENIINFLRTIPAERKVEVKYEDIVAGPETSLKKLTDFLHVNFEKNLLNPYNNKEKLISDGITSESRSMGDIKFNGFKKIESKVAHAWKKTSNKPQLTGDSKKLAKIFKYAIEDTKETTSIVIPKTYKSCIPLSFAQERLWFIEQYENDTSAYHIPIFLRLKETVNIRFLKQSLMAIFKRHNILRTVFVEDEDEGYCQHVLNDLPQIIDLKVKRKELSSRIQDDVNSKFDLSNSHPIKAFVYRTENKRYLLVNVHHIAFDGWSTDIFLKELGLFYRRYEDEIKVNLPKLKIQYKDFSVWHRNYLKGEILSKQVDYWKNKLSGFETLNLPTDRIRPSEINYSGDHYLFEIGQATSNKLKKLSSKNNTTIYNVLLTAFYILLYKYTGQKDIVLGTPIANRHYPQLEKLIGFFANSIPLRLKLEPSDNFNGLAQKVISLMNGVQKHQDLPFEKMVDILDVPKDASKNPIFQVIFAVQSFGTKVLDKSLFKRLDIQTCYKKAKFDLSLFIDDGSDELACRFNYATSLFNKETIKRISKHFCNLLEKITSSSSTQINKIQILSSSEFNQIIYDWNKTEVQYPKAKTIQQLFEEQVDKTPDSIAVVFKNSALTYRELNKRANQLAHTIRHEYRQHWDHKVKSDTLIGIYLERSPEMIVGILGILKSGAAYVPFDNSDPVERLKFKINDCACKMVITSTLAAKDLIFLADTDTLPLAIDSYSEEIAKASYKNPKHINKSNDLAYVIYTSGSTGKPKGVMIEHYNITRLVYGQSYINFKNNITAFASNIAFDASTFEIWGTLLHGAKMVIFTKEDMLNFDEFVLKLNAARVKTIWLTAGLFNAINSDLARLKHVRYILAGGDVINKESALNLLKNNINIKLINGYGPTETTTFASTYPINQESLNNTCSSIPIGSPLANTKLYVLNDEMCPTPVGVVGQLYIGGDGLGRGYLKNPEITAERFINNPFASEYDKANNQNNRIYKTGDLVRWLPDGNLEFIGRTDDQIKIRGFRIELGEIESTLAEHPNIKQCAVVAREYNGNKYLTAYYSQASGSGLQASGSGLLASGSGLQASGSGLQASESKFQATDSRLQATESKFQASDNSPCRAVSDLSDQSDQSDQSDSLRAFLRKKLPDYMVPSYFVKLKEFPLNTSGKIDRMALPDPERKSDEFNYAAPHGELEKMLCRIWQKFLGIEKIGVNDDFFRIGGDSILSMQIISKVRSEGYGVTVKDIFEYRTIKKLAENVLQGSKKSSINVEGGILEGKFDLLPIQSWFFEKALEKPNHWNQSFLIKVPELDTSKLKYVIEKLSRHHDILRTTFKDGKQFYNKSIKLPALRILDRKNLSDNEVSETLTSWQSVFDIEKGPLWSIGYVHGYKDCSARIFFAAHHLIIDAVSWRILAEDIKKLYEGKSPGQKNSSYRQWLKCINNYAKQHKAETLFWEQIVENQPDYSKLSAKEASTTGIAFDQEFTSQLLKKSNTAYHTEINDILLTALAYSLKDTLDEDVSWITLEGHGREQISDSIDVSRTLGWFTTAYPVKLETKNDIGSSIKSIKEELRKIAVKGMGYGASKYYGNSKTLKKRLLPLISFNYLGQFGSKDEYWQLTMSETSGISFHPDNKNNNVINISGFVADGELRFNISSRLNYKKTTKLNKSFKSHLTKIVKHCASQKNPEYTTSDFEEASINQGLLDRLQKKYQIEAIYPANSLQQGFMYHAINFPDDDAYRVQLLLDYRNKLDTDKYCEAWSYAVKTYPSLRLCFNWEKELIQIVCKDVAVDFKVIDISEKSDKYSMIEEIQKADRKIPFAMDKPGLLRLSLIKHSSKYYTLLKSQHHSITDGWSYPILLNFVHNVYSKLLAGETVTVKEESGYLEAQKYYYKNYHKVKEYWDNKIKLLEEVNDLSCFFKKKLDPNNVRSVKDSKEELLRIDGSLRSNLLSLVQSTGTTLNIVLQFAWHKLLSIYTRSSKTIVGTIVSGRGLSIEGIEDGVGLYVNTLPLAIDWKIDSAIRIQLSKIHREITELNTHSFINLSSLQKDGRRLFHSLFAFENYPVPESNNTDSQLNVKLRYAVEKIDYPIGVIAYERNGIIIRIKYASELIDKKTVVDILAKFKIVLEQITEDPDQKHSNICLLSNKEYNQIIYDWNDTEAQYPKGKTIHQLFEEQAKKTPDNIAVSCEKKRLTYRELNNKANKLAHTIRHEYKKYWRDELKSDTLIGIYIERSLEMMIGILGILKSGAAYVPFDTADPEERLKFKINDCCCKLILTSSECIKDLLFLTEKDTVPLAIGSYWQEIEKAPRTNPIHINKSKDLAYVIYTSGSTGRPKGVMIEHGGVCNLAKYIARKFNISEATRVLQFASICFDASVYEWIGTLTSGGHLILLSKNEIGSNPDLSRLLYQKKVNVAMLPPSVIGTMAKRKLPQLFTMVSGAEVCPQETVDIWAQNRVFINAYGPTEVTVASSMAFCKTHCTPNIGKPVANKKVYVLDDNMQPCPIGVCGELYIGGDGIARGYLDRPELTKEKFLNNPFASKYDKEMVRNTKIYKTGDLVCWLPDGNLRFVGRKDEQVKIRGFRIELGEIESTLAKHPDIKQCVVLAKEHNNNRHIVAYYTIQASGNRLQASENGLQATGYGLQASENSPCQSVSVRVSPCLSVSSDQSNSLQKARTYTDEHRRTRTDMAKYTGLPQKNIQHPTLNTQHPQTSTQHLEAFLKEKLPEYMVPAYFIKLEEFPLNISGKVDKEALPDPGIKGDRANYELPRNDLERQLAAIWQDILIVRKIGINDDFFRLGGDSILNIKLVNRISEQTNLKVKVLDVFKYPTINKLVINCSSSVLVEIPKTSSKKVPLSFAQERLCFIEEYEGGSNAYNVPIFLELSDKVSITLFKKSLRAVFMRHEVFRTILTRNEGKNSYYQRVVLEPPSPNEFNVKKEKLFSRVQKDTNCRFDLFNFHPVKVFIYNTEGTRYLLVNIHHIAFDGWSIDIFLKELNSHYCRHLEKTTQILPKLNIQYKDFSAWQRNYLKGDVLSKLIDYWTNKLAGCETLNFPTDRVRPTEVDYNGNYHAFEVNKTVSNKLKKLACEQNTTNYNILLAAFYILLYKYAGQKDLILGTPVANRHYPGLENIIGFFVNSIPVRLKLESSDSFKSLSEKVIALMNEVQEHQDIPFEKMVEILNLPKDPSRNPIFQIMFGVQSFGKTVSDKDLFRKVEIENYYKIAKFDLSLFIDDSSDKLTCRFNYATSLFNENTIKHLANHFCNILKKITSNSNALINDIQILSASEYKQIIYDWNKTEASYPKNKTIHQLFEEQVEKTPDNIAVVCEDRQLTYLELNTQANQLAHTIRREYKKYWGYEIKSDTLIGIYIERSLEMMVGILGVLKSGAAYVPFDTADPEVRLKFKISDSCCKFILTSSECIKELLFLSPKDTIPLAISSYWKEIQKAPTTNPVQISKPENLAYVIYTSGSTGRPKGVMIEHAGVCNLARYVAEKFRISNATKVLQFASICFDASVYEWIGTLTSGGQLILLSKNEIASNADISEVLHQKKINVAMLPPSVIGTMTKRKLPNLYTMVSGAEACTQDIVDKWAQNRLFINAYGPTEITVASSMAACKAHSIPNIGKPIANKKVYVLDDHMNPCPIGVCGELYIGGDGIARGYLDRPELTKEKFLNNPFASKCDKAKNRNLRIYKTGDLVKWLPNGNLKFVERKDEQVKIRGFRIELGEIELTLAEHPDIKQCAVVTKEYNGNKYITAYYSQASGSRLQATESKFQATGSRLQATESKFQATGSSQQASGSRLQASENCPSVSVRVSPCQTESDLSDLSDSLRAFLSQKLPEYMIPTYFVQVKEFPLNTSGKIDRKILPDPEIKGDKNNYESPRSDLERELVAIWQEMLSADKIGINDDFFRLGGNSILTIKLVNRISEQTNLKVRVPDVFKYPTINKLITNCANSNFVKIPKTSSRRVPLSFAQERLWFIEQYEGGSNAYYIPICLELDGSVNINSLKKSLRSIFARHKIFRTIFMKDKAGNYCQHVLNELPKIVDLKLKKDQLFLKIKENVNSKFDLAKSHPVKVFIYHTEKQKLLLVNVHHIAFDGWSSDIFLKELDLYYLHYSDKATLNLPKLDIQYKDFSAWQRNYLKGKVLKTQTDYWKNKLVNCETLNFPTDYIRPPEVDYRGAYYSFELSKTISSRLKKFASQHNSTIYNVLLTAFYILLYKYTGQKDLVLGTPIANRHHPQLENLIGFFVNSIPLRLKLESSDNFKSLLAKVKKLMNEIQEHQDLPFEKIVEILDTPKDLSRNPIFQIMFGVQSFGATLTDKKLFKKIPMEDYYKIAKFDLSLFIDDASEKFSCCFDYATSLFNEKTIKHISEHFCNLLEKITSNYNEPINDIQILSNLEYNQLVYGWNRAPLSNTEEKTVHQLFEEQVEKTPDKVAVVFQDTKLTYRELNNKANQLAHTIRREYKKYWEHDVKADNLIGIYMERSLEMIVGILGILKSGATYVPFDTADPEDRLKLKLNDCACKIIIATSAHSRNLLVLTRNDVLQLAVDSYREKIQKAPKENPGLVTRSTDLAYVIYTSGSTGTPKGVMVEHKTIVNLINHQSNVAGIDFSNNVIQLAAFNFDVSVQEIFSTLSNGGSLHILPQQIKYNIAELLNYIRNQKINTIFLPPALLDLVFSEENKLAPRKKPLCVIAAGEQLAINKTLKINISNNKVIVYNHYGPTESHVVSDYRIDKNSHILEHPPIGKPISNTALYVLDSAMQPVTIGAPGELYIGGNGLARGYLDNTDLTKKRFIANPFATKQDKEKSRNLKIYKTGDIVKWLPDGNLQFIGRNDDQIKIRGFRVELGEIESTLAGHPGIKQCAVVAKENNGNKYLAAYYTQASGYGLQASESKFQASGYGLQATENSPCSSVSVRVSPCQSVSSDSTQHLEAFLSEKLPDYMVPTYFVKLKEFPLNTSGKIDKKALPEPELIPDEEGYVAPRNDLEAKLCKIWKEILGSKRIGINDNFFKLGGNSILTIKLVNIISQKTTLKISVPDIFKHPTINDLTSKCFNTTSVVIPKTNKKKVPLSFAQERLWFIEQYEGGSNAYNMPIFWELRDLVNVNSLEKSLKAIFKRHEIFRTIFKKDKNGVYYQQILKKNPQIVYVNVKKQQLFQKVKEDVNCRFDLASSHPVKVFIYITEEKRYILINIHHIAFDGWSADIFLKELSEYYHHYANILKSIHISGTTVCPPRLNKSRKFRKMDRSQYNTKLELPKQDIQYKDFSAWQRNYLKSETLKKQADYWKNQLEGYETLNFPTDRIRLHQVDYKGDYFHFEVNKDTSIKLKKLASEYKTTNYNILLTAFYILLFKYTNQKDIILGTPIANRHYTQLENIVGFFVNSIPLRLKLESSDSFSSLSEKVMKLMNEVQEYQDLPFEKMVDILNVPADPSRNPIFQIMFAVQNFGKTVFDRELFKKAEIENCYKIAKFDLSLFIDDSSDKLKCYFNYATSLFNKNTIMRLSKYFRNILQKITSKTNSLINDIQILSAPEYNQIIYEWNATKSQYPKNKTIHQLFEKQVEKTPAKVAVVLKDAELTYRELNNKANQLAYTIRNEYKKYSEQELKTDTLIGIYMERSLQMVVGILGILKAGAAYVPFDTADPEDRLKLKLNDCSCKAIITSSAYSQNLLVLNKNNVLQLNLDTYKEKIEKAPKTNPNFINRSTDLAYVIYTSGSTGTPKGVMVEHKTIVNLINHQSKVAQIDFSNNVLQLAAFNFDVSVQEIFSTLSAGGCLHVLPQLIKHNITELINYIKKREINIVFLPPALLNLVFSEENNLALRKKPLCVIAAGEQLAINKTLRKNISDNNIIVYNHYGPTESHVVSDCRIDNNSQILEYPPIGKPISNAKLYVLDIGMVPVPIGVPGELYIGGNGLARGYLGNTKLTKKRFIDNPFATKQDNEKGHNLKIYKTGDIVKWLPDGNLEFIGRNDDQIKIRGFRVELGEIESTLAKHPAIKQCVVVAREHNENKYLAAYYTQASGSRLQAPESKFQATGSRLQAPESKFQATGYGLQTSGSRLQASKNCPCQTMSDKSDLSDLSDLLQETQTNTDEHGLTRTDLAKYTGLSQKTTQHPTPNTQHLEAFLSEKLPDYMVPTYFVKLKALPLNTNGKVNKKALPEPEIKGNKENYIAPRNDLEAKLCKIWQEVLGIKSVGINDDFFNLGGNSILSIHLASKIRHQGYNLNIKDIFEYRTIKLLAKAFQKTEAIRTNNKLEETILDQAYEDFELAKKEIAKLPPIYKHLPPEETKGILLTGASGFLGVYLLESLLTNTKADIYCLIRSNNSLDIKNKFFNNLKHYRKERLINDPRIKLLKGDLSEKNIGLSKKDKKIIEDKVDSIYHNGANVHHVYSYSMLRKANTISAIEMIKLSLNPQKPKTLHFVSTVGAAQPTNNRQNTLKNAKFEIPPPSTNGYLLTKWLAEKIFIHSSETKQLPVAIYRAGNVTGDSKQGYSNYKKNHLILLLKGCSQMGIAPDFKLDIEMTPVDILAETIIKLSQQNNPTPKIYNLDNPKIMNFLEYFKALRKHNYNLKSVSPEQFKKQLLDIDEKNAMFALKEVYLNKKLETPQKPSSPSQLTHETQRVLKTLNIKYPDDYSELISIYLDYLKQENFI